MAVQIYKTSCTMDCPDTCALEVTTSGGRVEKIEGAKNHHPNTAGFICTKVARFSRRLYHPDRILHPLRRTGIKGSGQFEQISWDDALTEIAIRFQDIVNEWGGEAIYPYHYGGSNGILGDSLLDHYFFAKLGASRCEKTLCAAPSSAVALGMYGKMPGVAFQDFPQAQFILIWGANPKASNIHLVPYLAEARKNGCFIAVVDPAKNFSDSEVDLHLPVFPGADLPLALGIINYWHQNSLLDQSFLEANTTGSETLLQAAAEWPLEKAAEASGVSTEIIQHLAEKYAESAPALLRCGWGVERNQNGGQAVAAIMAMPALLGKFGVQGGGYTMSNSGGAKFNRDEVVGKFKWETRNLNQSVLGEQLCNLNDPPIKSLFVYNCNPVATTPDQNRIIEGLMREDLFTVVSEQVMTDTCAFADIVLPAVTFLEQEEIRKSYGAYVAGGVQATIDPCGEAKPNEWLFAALGRQMGWDDIQFQWDTSTYMKKVTAALTLGSEQGDQLTLSTGRTQAYKFDGETPIQFQSVWPQTEDRKVNLAPEQLGSQPYSFADVNVQEYPLALISPANNKMISSTFGEFNYPVLFLTMHPKDASARQIRNGDPVRVFNDLGEVLCRAKVKESVREGVVSMPKGAWRKSAINKSTSTALCPATTNTVGGGACFNDARVQVEKHQE